jgi:hypothetical protein
VNALAVATLLLLLFPASSQAARPYRSLAVMDLQTTGVSQEEAEEFIDHLTLRIRETGTIRRVLEREKRERLLNRRGAVQAGEGYQSEQLAAARVLKVDLAVLGIVTWNRQQYTLDLRLLDVSSGQVLWEEGHALVSWNDVLGACDYLASTITAAAARGSRPRTEARKQREPLDLLLGFSPGQVGVSASSAVAGGSYFYTRSNLMFNRHLGVGARYAFRLFPTIWADHLLSFDLRFQAPLENDIWVVVEGGYLFSFGKQGFGSHLVGVRLSPFAGGEDQFMFELLPMALYFDLSTGEAVFMLELLALVVFFPLK